MKRLLAATACAVVLGLSGIARAEPPASTMAKVYDETADARTQISEAIASAKSAGKRVLIQWGGNWCPWCLRMNDLMHQNAEIAGVLDAGYVLIHVDCGRPAMKNVPLAKFFKTNVEQEGFPYFTVLDGEGQVVANQGTRGFELEPEKGHEESLKLGEDPAKVLKFLRDFAPPVKAAEVAKPAGKAKPVYDESADARVQIAQALDAAKRNNRRVLIQWGGNWCPWCLALHRLMTEDKAIAKVLRYEYDVVHVDCGKPQGKNEDLASEYKAEVRKEGFPYLTVLDADGKVLADQETSSLEVKNASGESVGVKAGHDPARVLSFLEKYKAPRRDARYVIEKGYGEARGTGRTALVHFGAPWCPWCVRLDAWLARPDVAKILGKDFVDVKIDTERDEGGQSLLEEHRRSKEGGIPWMELLGENGQPIANSDGPKGNIGFPAEPEEIAYFRAMLKKATRRLGDQELDALMDSLRAKSSER
jgi:thiol-disulfide isomerase/thioredoxin